MKLDVRCGLRTHEIVQAVPEDVADTDAGTVPRVWESTKTDHHRKTPICRYSPMPSGPSTASETSLLTRRSSMYRSASSSAGWRTTPTNSGGRLTSTADSSSGSTISGGRGPCSYRVLTWTRCSSVTGVAGATSIHSPTTVGGLTRLRRSDGSARNLTGYRWLPQTHYYVNVGANAFPG